MLGRLFEAVSVKEAKEKVVAPTTCMTFLGTQLDTVNMTLIIPSNKMVEIKSELSIWHDKILFHRRELESGTKKDIHWWLTCMQEHNGISPLWLADIQTESLTLLTDACLTGIGGTCNGEYYHARIDTSNPDHTKYTNIAQIEMLVILVGIRLWSKYLADKYILIKCGNQSVVACINNGRCVNPVMLDCMRAIAFECALNNCIVKTRYLTSRNNLVPDLLSRWYQDGSARRRFKQLNTKFEIEAKICECTHN